jgi:hypothetical protein
MERVFTRWLSILLFALLPASASAAPPGAQHENTVDTGSVDAPLDAAVSLPAAQGFNDTTWIADWSFDGATGCDGSGWTHYDDRILNDGSNYWTVSPSFAGSGGITGYAAVLRKHDLVWAHDGYGNDWDYSIVLQYRGTGSTLSFQYVSDSEPSYDFVTVEADSLGLSESRVNYATNPADVPAKLRRELFRTDGYHSSGSVSLLALPDFGLPASTHEVYIRFASDAGWSDEDGLYPTAIHAGLVVDQIAVSGGLAYTEDFECGAAGCLNPNMQLLNTAPATPFGEWARLFQHVTDNDNCSENTTCSWIFSDPRQPAYFPDMAFGPFGIVLRNWLDDVLVSPWVSLSTAQGAAATLLSYRRFPGNTYSKSKIALNWRVRSRVRVDNTDTSAPGDSLDAVTAWAHTLQWSLMNGFKWGTAIADLTSYVPAGAREIQVSFRVSDWQLIGKDPPPATLDPGPGPYLDRVRIGRRSIAGPSITPPVFIGVALDGFASYRNTIPHGENFSPSTDRFGTSDFANSTVSLSGDPTITGLYWPNTGDSIAVRVLDPANSHLIGVSLYVAIVSGPHRGKAPPPWSVGTNGFFFVPAIELIYGGSSSGYWFVDLDDEYFRGGDVVLYYWAATDAAGGFASYPPGCPSSPASVAEAEAATGGLLEFSALPTIDWDPGYLARIAAHPSGKLAPTPEEIARSRQRTCILYVQQVKNVDGVVQRRSGPINRTAFMYALDRLGYAGLYDVYDQTGASNYNGHLAGRASVEEATGYSLIIQDSGSLTAFYALPPGGKREGVFNQNQWYRDWLARAPQSEAGRATLWILGEKITNVDIGADNPLVRIDMGVSRASESQGLLPYPNIVGEDALVWASGDTTNFSGDLLTLDSNNCTNRGNNGLAATGTAVVTHRYSLGGTAGDGAAVMNVNRALGWNTILTSFSWKDLRDPFGGSAAGVETHLLQEILAGVLPESCRARAHPTDTPGGRATLPAATSLHQNVPNPFNPVTSIRFDLAHAGTVTLRVFDVAGHRVRGLVDGWMPAGWNHRVIWNGLDDSGHRVASGIYIYRLTTRDYASTRKMVMLK